MSLITYEPWSAVSRLHRDIERIFGGSVGSQTDVSATGDWVPAVDIHEEKDRFILRADLPGIDAKDIQITMEDGALILQGERSATEESTDKGIHRVERYSGRFYRRFRLPDSVDGGGISAKSSNGVLEVVIPKVAEVQPRRITVDVA